MGPINSGVYTGMLFLAGLGVLLLAGALFTEYGSAAALIGIGSLSLAALCFVYLWFAAGVIEVPDD